MEAWCVRCKTKQEMRDTEAAFASNGTPITKGICSVCGGKLTLFGKTPAHEGLEKPVVAAKPKAKRTVKKTTSTTASSATKKPVSKASTGGSKVTARIGKNQKLVIVESPAKARTVGRFLGHDYVVRASVGHVRDLLKSTLSVDVENDFQPKYRVPNEKKALVKELTALAEGAKQVYLATDPDREGEAIAWHLVESASIDPTKTERVVFHEITQPAIEAAFNNPSEIDMSLVDAQQARRVLDRLVGYKLSPLLWAKIHGHLSAGRVQSVAVKLVVDREREIENFEAREYWTISAELQPEGGKTSFLTRLIKVNGADPQLASEAEVQEHLKLLEKALYTIKTIKSGVRKRRPSPPFTTSTLQQEASKRLGFTSKRTMMLAQQLYEGLDLGGAGISGLITYMRTDSTNISEIAQAEARKYIYARFGDSFAPPKPPVYSKKAKGAQEAHEAVRPTNINNTPDSLKEYLNRDQLRLYQLIWQRFLASQMADAIYETKTIDVEAIYKKKYLFRSSGSKLTFQGFIAVYEDAKDEDSKDDSMENTKFPDGLQEGQQHTCKRLIPEQHFTQPPARYTEATLVKTMEENGIGRPSTYASIISTIQQRAYVYIEAKRLFPTETGILVNDFLVEHFPSIVDVGFTSLLEGDLDKVADGDKGWVSVVREFYDTFEPALEKAEASMPRAAAKVEPEKVGRDCPDCGLPLVIRHGRFGKFISCSGFPKCHYTENIVEKMGIACPECGGDMIVRRTRKGKVFYGCLNYPKCQFTLWKKPVKQKCPECGGMLVISGKNKAQCLTCKKEVHIEEEA